MGPIPACTGETQRCRRTSPLMRAYPRMHGGNSTAILIISFAAGLSPHARGKRAGRTCGQRGLRPIPACTGETIITAFQFRHDRAYPRMHGGNAWKTIPPPYARGLSPHARGKHAKLTHGLRPWGPIPACTGETASSTLMAALPWAYPRMHGGNSPK